MKKANKCKAFCNVSFKSNCDITMKICYKLELVSWLQAVRTNTSHQFTVISSMCFKTTSDITNDK